MAKSFRQSWSDLLLALGMGPVGPRTDPEQALQALRDTASGRKFRLFACACCRRVWPRLSPEFRAAVEVSERYADGLASLDEFASMGSRAREVVPTSDNDHDVLIEDLIPLGIAAVLADDPFDAALTTVRSLRLAGSYRHGRFLLGDYHYLSPKLREAEAKAQVSLLNDIFPLSKTALAWQSVDGVGIAQAIYDDRAFDRLPILADALEDAGCDNADILNHCRQPSEHVRGCWVVDLVLGK
jgi:hypothetical protein